MYRMNTLFLRKWADAYLLSIEGQPDASFERKRVLEQLEALTVLETQFRLKSQGGRWLACAREWILQRCINGSVRWGSHDQLKMGGRGLSVSDIEGLAAVCAAEAVNQFKGAK